MYHSIGHSPRSKMTSKTKSAPTLNSTSTKSPRGNVSKTSPAKTSPAKTSPGIKKTGSRNRLNFTEFSDGGTDGRKTPTAQKPSGPSLCSVVDVDYIPLAVDLCHWIAEQTSSFIEIDQFITCLQDGLVLCRLVNVINKLKSEKDGEPFKLVHFRENIGNSVFFARINIETFIRWSKTFGVPDNATSTVSDFIDMKDVMQALSNVYSVGRKCAELGLPHPKMVALEVEYNLRYDEIIGLFNPEYGVVNENEQAVKEAFIKLVNQRGLGNIKIDTALTEYLGMWKKRLVGKSTSLTEPILGPLPTPPPEPTPPTTPEPTPDPENPVAKTASIVPNQNKENLNNLIEAKMGPWDAEEITSLIEMYKEQIDEYGDDHIDFQLLSKQYDKRHPYRTPHQCWDKMYQLIERYQCDISANKLFKRKVCSGPHHDQLHLCLGDTDLTKHLNAVYTGMMHPKTPVIPAYINCDAQERENEEMTGRAQIAEQTSLLRDISNQLKVIRDQTERNAATNAALLVLMTHVLKGTEESSTPPTSKENSDDYSTPEVDAKSLGSDVDLVEKIEA